MTDNTTELLVLRSIEEFRKEVRTELAAFRGDLSGSIHGGLSTVNGAIAALTEAHNNALREQERRNGEFLTRAQHLETERLVQMETRRNDGHDVQLQKLTDVTENIASTLRVMSEQQAGFATQARLEELIQQVHGHSNRLQTHTVQISSVQRCLDDLSSRFNVSDHDEQEHTVAGLNGTVGYLFTAMMAVGIAVLSFLLAHVGHL